MSNPSNPNHSSVKHTPLNPHKVAAGVTTLQGLCVAGAASPDVQGSPLVKQALTNVQTAVTTLDTSLVNKTNLANALAAAGKALKVDFLAAEAATRTYESSVNTLAAGDGAVITRAGCLTRAAKTPAAALGAVKDVVGKPGKAAKESIVTWPEVKGATSFAIQVNFTPTTPNAPYTALPSGTSRRRLVMAPAPGAQFLVQIAAIARDGTQSAWCDAVMATAK